MTADQWRRWDDPWPVLSGVLTGRAGPLSGALTGRKARLFAAACARAAGLAADPRVAEAVAEAEAFADARTNAARARPKAVRAGWGPDRVWARSVPGRVAWAVLSKAPVARAAEVSYLCGYHVGGGTPAAVAERRRQGPLLRDVVGDPFRPAGVARRWRTSAAVGLAAGMYAARDFAALPVLADALEDAGCDSPELLAHLRGPGPHVRGCWAVDLVLGKG